MLPMNEVSRILGAVGEGGPEAAAQLLPLVYDELRKLAAHRLTHQTPGQTLQPTALVHEAYLRLVSDSDQASWDNRGHFFAAAAAPFLVALAAGVFNQDAAHGLGGRGEEVPAAVPVLWPGAGDQAEVGLVDQGGRLERVIRSLGCHPRGGEFAQFVVDERQEFGGGFGVAGRGRRE